MKAKFFVALLTANVLMAAPLQAKFIGIAIGDPGELRSKIQARSTSGLSVAQYAIRHQPLKGNRAILTPRWRCPRRGSGGSPR